MKSSKLPEFSPTLYGPAPLYKKRFSCMAILLLLGALIGGIIAWFMPRVQQDCVYGPPPIEEQDCVYGPPSIEEPEPQPELYGPPPIEEPKPRPNLYGPRPVEKQKQLPVVY